MGKNKFIEMNLTITIIYLIIIVSVFSSGTSSALKQSYLSVINGDILYVGGNGPSNYSSIQDAIDDAENGDTVFVYDDSSPYYETLEVDKSIRLIGENKVTTIIDGEKIDNVISIIADEVNISGFTIRNCDDEWWLSAGIETNSDYNIIFNNIFANNMNGIFIGKTFSDFNKVFSNIFANNSHGLRIDGSNNSIFNNTIQNNNVGIEIGTWIYKHNVVSNNTLENNEYGIITTQSEEIEIIGNNIIGGYAGINVVKGTMNYIISYNIVSGCDFGIAISGFAIPTDINTISMNTIRENTVGLYLIMTEKNDIYWNTIDTNYLGIWFEERVFNNSIYENNITNNKGKIVDGGGILIWDSTNNNFSRNNFINNFPTARFVIGILYIAFWEELSSIKNEWHHNYWDEPRNLPRPIFGRIGLWFAIIPWINFDWDPVQEPHHIPYGGTY